MTHTDVIAPPHAPSAASANGGQHIPDAWCVFAHYERLLSVRPSAWSTLPRPTRRITPTHCGRSDSHTRHIFVAVNSGVPHYSAAAAYRIMPIDNHMETDDPSDDDGDDYDYDCAFHGVPLMFDLE